MENPENSPRARIPETLVAILVCAILLGEFFVFFPDKINRFSRFFTAGTSSSVSVTVANATPEASGVSLNGGDAITLTENTTKSVVVAGTVTDNNSCKDLTSVSVGVYKDGTTCDSADDADNDNCYWITDSSPATDSSCTGDSDVAYELPSATFTFALQFYAEPGDWKATVYPSDAGAGTPSTGTAVALNELQSLSVDSSLSFGSVAPGASSTSDHVLAVTNTGNMSIDFNVKGNEANMTCTTRGQIPVGNEQYQLASFAYGDPGAVVLTTSDANVNAELPKPTSSSPSVADNTYWQILIPTGVAGTCSGSIVFTAIGAL